MREQYDDDINSRSYWPVNLPPRELTRRALRLLERGWSQEHVCEKTGLTSNRVLAISRLPHRYDPDDDEVAVKRALRGDPKVLGDLSFYERQVVMDSLVARLDAEPYDHSVNNWRGFAAETHWLTVLMADWGVTEPRRLRGRIERRVTRMRAAA